ncbi:polysaccharide deacetylase family protein [Candidatus Nitrospira bockiana]
MIGACATLWKRLRQAGRGAACRIVLVYHRVADVPSDPWGLAVSPGHFSEHLEVLRRLAAPCRLNDMTSPTGRPPRRVAVTFDDGYADNLLHGRPILERYDVPATVFVTTGSYGRQREFWWDDLERVLLTPGTLPGRLALVIDGRRYEWRLDGASRYEASEAAGHRGWRAWESTPTARHAVYRAIWELLQPLAEGERIRVLQGLYEWAGVEPLVRPSHRALTSDEMLMLAEDGLIEIGAHTVSHPVLSRLSRFEQQEEVRGSRRFLEEVLGRPVTAFAYPYGKPADFNEETLAVLRESGVRHACVNVPGRITEASDPLRLPRMHVQDWDGEEFERRLSAWLNG